MYQDIVDDLVLPIEAEDVKGFAVEDDVFVIKLKDGKTFKAFDLMESLLRSEFESICRMISDKITSV